MGGHEKEARADHLLVLFCWTVNAEDAKNAEKNKGRRTTDSAVLNTSRHSSLVTRHFFLLKPLKQ
jgi:hypothetical protein